MYTLAPGTALLLYCKESPALRLMNSYDDVIKTDMRAFKRGLCLLLVATNASFNLQGFHPRHGHVSPLCLTHPMTHQMWHMRLSPCQIHVSAANAPAILRMATWTVLQSRSLPRAPRPDRTAGIKHALDQRIAIPVANTSMLHTRQPQLSLTAKRLAICREHLTADLNT